MSYIVYLAIASIVSLLEVITKVSPPGEPVVGAEPPGEEPGEVQQHLPPCHLVTWGRDMEASLQSDSPGNRGNQAAIAYRAQICWATIYNGKLPSYIYIWNVKGEGKLLGKEIFTFYTYLMYNEQLYNFPFSALHFPS